MIGAQSVPFGNSFAVIGGRASSTTILDTVFAYEPADQSWTRVNQTLTSNRFNAAAFLVPLSSLPTC